MAAACGEDSYVVAPLSEAEAAATARAAPAEPPPSGDPAERDAAEPPDPSTDPDDTEDADGADSGAAAGNGAGADGDEGARAHAGDDTDAEAVALLASAAAAPEGRSFRGEATFDLALGLALTAAFESDAEGDLAARTELPPGMDPEFPGGAEVETRYVGDAVYVRPPVPAAVLAELGLEEAWYVDEPSMGDDPIAQAMGSSGAAMCVFPQADGDAVEDCDPLGEIEVFLAAARSAEIVGSEDVRGVETTRVRLMVSLLDLVGEALGMAPDGGTAEAGAFDDTVSDPFAEGLDQMLGLSDLEFEIGVWIDDGNLIRRLSLDLASLFAGPDTGAETPSSRMTLEFYDFDADISVEAPPPESIVDEDLLRDADRAASGEYEP